MSKSLKPIPAGSDVRLNKFDPSDKAGLKDKDSAAPLTEAYTTRIGELQDMLYADGTRALLIVLQGMDGSGKDGTVRHVFDHVNPSGVDVTSFKAPTALERRHDFLWRAHKAAPALGTIGIFNRSHYEDVLIVRVHAAGMLPENLRDEKHLWRKRFELINSFEEDLAQNGTTIRKFFLHISKGEQRDRFLDRQREKDKQWKLSPDDLRERAHWDEYQSAYEDVLSSTNTEQAPWHIVPADHKWVRDHCIARVVCETLEEMDLRPPVVTDKALLKAKIV